MASNKKIKSIVAGLGVAASIVFYFAIPQEGISYVSYLDGGGVWTIGRGHTDGVYQGMTATKSQADKWYVEDVAKADAAYERLVTFKHPDNVKAASVDFIFNAGAGNFSGSTLRKKLNAGDRLGACNQFPRWKYMGPVDCSKNLKQCGGLITRRQNEKELCLSDEILVCDYNSGACIPDGLRSAQLSDQQAGSKAQD